MQDNQEFTRQEDIFNPNKKYNQFPITIIGAGGIGSFTSLSIAKLGFKNIKVWDADKIEPHNIPNQLYKKSQVGQLKVVALQENIKEYTEVEITPVLKRFNKRYNLDGVVISAVDSIAVRKRILEKIKLNPQVFFYIDGRIGGENIQIYSFPPSLVLSDVNRYEKSLDGEALNLPCTARAIIDIGFYVGALIARAVRTYIVDRRYNYLTIYYAGTGNQVIIE